MIKPVVLAIFEDEAAADRAVQGLNRWAGDQALLLLVDTHQLQAVGVVTLDADDDVKTRIVALLPKLHRLPLSAKDRESLRRELQGGKAAVAVLTDWTSADGISAELHRLGGVTP